MKVKCTSNHLSDLLLTGYHRDQLAAQFGACTEPIWRAEVGKEYTVYAVTIRRGCPFYLVAGRVRHLTGGGTDQAYEIIPSVCFEVLDSRTSRYWRIETTVVDHRGGQVFHTTLAFKEWFEPMFISNLVEARSPEVERMRTITAEMDDEFV